jgi:hypothetical protein
MVKKDRPVAICDLVRSNKLKDKTDVELTAKWTDGKGKDQPMPRARLRRRQLPLLPLPWVPQDSAGPHLGHMQDKLVSAGALAVRLLQVQQPTGPGFLDGEWNEAHILSPPSFMGVSAARPAVVPRTSFLVTLSAASSTRGESLQRAAACCRAHCQALLHRCQPDSKKKGKLRQYCVGARSS